MSKLIAVFEIGIDESPDNWYENCVAEVINKAVLPTLETCLLEMDIVKPKHLGLKIYTEKEDIPPRRAWKTPETT